jgi:hypothetical protein
MLTRVIFLSHLLFFQFYRSTLGCLGNEHLDCFPFGKRSFYADYYDQFFYKKLCQFIDITYFFFII